MMKKKNKRRMASKLCASVALMGAVCSASVGTAAAADNWKDIADDWSKNAVVFAVENGMMQGHNGLIHASRAITRAELAAMISRLFGTQKQADLSTYTDVDAQAWYTPELSKAVHMGIVSGADASLRPNDKVTREEAFVILARALCMNAEQAHSVTGFDDTDMVSSWATKEIGFLIAQQIVAGSENKIYPKNYLTRAEFAQLMMRAAGTVARGQGVFSQEVAGNVLVLTSGVSFENMHIKGDLIIADGVELGLVSLKNTTVAGSIVVRGAKNKISLDAGSSANELVLYGTQGTLTGTGKVGSIRGSAMQTDSSNLPTINSGNSGGTGSNTGSNTGSGTASYSLGMVPTFLQSITYTATLYQGNTAVTGYTLYADAVAIATDTDKNGTVTAPKALFEHAKVLEAVLTNGQRVVVTKK